ncbi:hypothetical protein P9112_000413 [Eukaryota sp. TZLM1-RC]
MESSFNEQMEFTRSVPTRPDEPIIDNIPKCQPPRGSDFCISLAYAPKCPVLDGIMNKIRTDSGLDEDDIRAFDDLESMDTYTIENLNVTQVAVNFPDLDSTSTSLDPQADIVYDVILNTTAWNCPNTNEMETTVCTLDPVNGIYLIVKKLVDQEIMKAFVGESVTLKTSWKRTVHPQLLPTDLYAMAGRMMTFFLFLIYSLNVLATLVGEKEKGIKMYLRLFSMTDFPYWFSHFIVPLGCFLILTLWYWAMGYMFDLAMFTETNPLLLIIAFLIISSQVIAFVFLISCFFKSTRAGVIAGFAIIMVSYMFDAIAVHLFIEGVDRWIRVLFTFYPTVPCELAMLIMATVAADTSSPGMSFGDLNTVYPNSMYTLMDSFVFMIRNTIICITLAWYFDNILPSGCGHRRPWYFPFTKSYWYGTAADVPDVSTAKHPVGKIKHDDIGKERELVMSLDPSSVPIIMKRLHKKFGNFTAVEDLCLKVENNELLALLGPNGAGKTTAIKSLISCDVPTGGACYVLGHPVGGIPSRDMLRKIGYCPQFDVLFDQLTFKEHLIIYSHLKGLDKKASIAEAERLLKDVQLTEASDKLSCEGSGGMQRRLAIAISLINNPQVLVLDEPTTGLDVRVRANLWEIIMEIRKDRAVIITTHSMEEAEQLSTRVAIMCHSRLHALGTSLRLRNAFGSGYKVLIEINDDSDVDAILGVLKTDEFLSADIEIVGHTSTLITLDVPVKSSHMISDLLREYEDKQNTFGFVDIGVDLTTLKDVFIDLRDKSDKEFVEEFPELAGKVNSRDE